MRGVSPAERYHAQIVNVAVQDAQQRLRGQRSNGALVAAVRALVRMEVLCVVVAFLKNRLTQVGKDHAARVLKTDLFAALLQQDLAYLEAQDLWDVRHMIGNAKHAFGSLLEFPVYVLEGSARIVAGFLVLWRRSRRLSVTEERLRNPLREKGRSRAEAPVRIFTFYGAQLS